MVLWLLIVYVLLLSYVLLVFGSILFRKNRNGKDYWRSKTKESYHH